MASRAKIVVLLAAVAVLGAAADASAASGSIFFTSGEQFKSVKRSLPDSGPQLPSALRLLFKGPSAAEAKRGLGSAIPGGTRVIKTQFDPATGLAKLRFNANFAKTEEEIKSDADIRRVYFARAGQVVFTATSLPGVEKVRLSVPGKPSYTLDRDSFEKPSKVPSNLNRPPKPKGPKPGDTKGLQQALANLTYLPTAAVTGNYDDRTKQAVLAFKAYNGLGRDGIAGPETLGALTSGAVPVPKYTTTGRHVEIDRALGIVLLVNGNKTYRIIHTSTGRGGSSTDLGTPPGKFKIYRKEKNSWSVPYKVWLPNAAYWDAGWALHGFADVPPYPASAGCARLPLTEAPVVFNYVKIGTPVYVI